MIKLAPLRASQTGIIGRSLLVSVVLCVALYGVFQLTLGHASAARPIIKSGLGNYCLDIHDDQKAASALVDSWGCNGTAAQSWKVTGSTITHNSVDCLAVASNSTSAGSVIVSNPCRQAAGQVWLSEKGGYYNPNSKLCLAVPDSKVGTQLALASCDNLSNASEQWSNRSSDATSSSVIDTSCNDIATKGEKIACVAEKQWTIWQSGAPDHTTLLNNYTNGYSYEEWCADFVSYVYKEAGYPFTGGESDGWDENLAGNIQNMGFTKHMVGSYVPQAGDVAYFDYDGGHVEIVVSGGKTPTFIYGNSGRVDPATGNGEMEANTILGDSNGKVLYYLTPN